MHSFILADVWYGAGDIFRENVENGNEAVNHKALENYHIVVDLVPYDH